MDELPDPRGPLTEEEERRLREAFDEWLLEEPTAQIAS